MADDERIGREIRAQAAADRRVRNLVRARATTRKRIEESEVPHLEALGREIRRLRRRAGLTIKQLAERADRSPSFLSDIERGVRRARRPTLAAIAAALSAGRPDALERRLVELAGPALAGDSSWPGWAEKIDRRRARRKRRRELDEQRWRETYRREDR